MKLYKKKYSILLLALLILTVSFKYGYGSILPIRRISVYTYPIYKRYKSEKTVNNLLKTGCSQVTVSHNIRIFWDKVEDRTIEAVVGNVEGTLRRILEDLDSNAPEKIDIAVLCQDNNIKIALDGYEISCCMGAYFRGIVLLCEPLLWMECCADFNNEFIEDGPLVHELTHCIVDYKTKGNKPTWFSEGVALLEDYRINGNVGKYGEQLADYYSIKELHSDFWELEQKKAYTQSYKIARYIADNFGMESISDIMEELGRGKTMNESVKKALGMNLQELFNKSLKPKAS